jgi:hypothetical protein
MDFNQPLTETVMLRSIEFDEFVLYKLRCSARSAPVFNYLQAGFMICSKDRWSHQRTVIQELFRKAGVRTRSQLVRIAIERHSSDWLKPEA